MAYANPLQIKLYPRLQEEVQHSVATKLREGEEKAKQHLSMFIDYQLSYINTNHEDFVGFAKCVSYSFHKSVISAY